MRIVGELQFNSTRKYSNGKKECFLCFTEGKEKETYLVAFKNKRKYTNNIYIVIEPIEKNLHLFDKFKYAKLIKVIGQIDDFNSRYEMLFYKYQFCIKKQEFDLLKTKDTRTDLSKFETISIDPEGSKDIDDALSIIDDKIYIHIADPTSYVKMKPMVRTSTIYNHRTINMYNDKICYDLCSLIKGKKRNAVTFIYDIKTKTIEDHELTIVKLDRNLSYEADDELINKLKKLICEDPHEIIEKLMVSVNLYVGNILSSIDKGIFRNYKIKEIEKLSKDKELNKYLKIIKGNSAEYSFKPEKHEYLDIENYCHFTSPLRRYVDTLNHLLFKKYIFEIDIEVPLINEELLEMINTFEKNHRRLHRDKNLIDLQKKVGDEIVNLEGYIIGSNSVMLSKSKIIVYVSNLKEEDTIYDKINIITYSKNDKFFFYKV